MTFGQGLGNERVVECAGREGGRIGGGERADENGATYGYWGGKPLSRCAHRD